MSETKETKTSRKGIVIVFGIICIILMAGMGGTIAFYTSIINDKNNTISSLNTQISDLKSNVTNLQKQITSDNTTINSLTSNVTNLLNGSTSLLDIVASDPSAWVNSTVTVEGVLSLVFFPVSEYAPWNYGLSSGNQTIGVSMSASVNVTALWNEGFNGSGDVRIYGVVEKGEITFTPGWGSPEVTYYIEAETVELL